jgi:hypothetical protein
VHAAWLVKEKQRVIRVRPGGFATSIAAGSGLVFSNQWVYTECARFKLVWRTPPMIHTAEVESLKQRIHQLQIEHRDLDDVISRLSQSSAQDQLQLQRLKKRKLFLKDQITMLERQLEPDIPA